ncbi:MAG: hypothetical protein WBP74_11790, partial [Nitrososphaeraceae archaeon]
ITKILLNRLGRSLGCNVPGVSTSVTCLKMNLRRVLDVIVVNYTLFPRKRNNSIRGKYPSNGN